MNKNQSLYEQSKKYIPGGVNSPVRAFSSVGGTPIFLKEDWEADFGMRTIRNTLTTLIHGAL